MDSRPEVENLNFQRIRAKQAFVVEMPDSKTSILNLL